MPISLRRHFRPLSLVFGCSLGQWPEIPYLFSGGHLGSIAHSSQPSALSPQQSDRMRSRHVLYHQALQTVMQLSDTRATLLCQQVASTPCQRPQPPLPPRKGLRSRSPK
ncbi:hypothetical protein BKA67DRAFT_571109 [Truncatella angustata]|uniref:Uncharacterized protein n=1 Tax=Truncatella angustata TaxID=152316 RepID=A0A9P8UG06_9PEZI|nr:uncharacterized protein BKA67DRAFT_571109 [Truncatella angustata]KAH6651506.1 hypothetical protein BKA67DRAFT_571109 [Truncatella angustata]